jgi:hypothetical protein
LELATEVSERAFEDDAVAEEVGNGSALILLALLTGFKRHSELRSFEFIFLQ